MEAGTLPKNSKIWKAYIKGINSHIAFCPRYKYNTTYDLINLVLYNCKSFKALKLSGRLCAHKLGTRQTQV